MIIAKFNVYLQQNSVNLYLDMGISKELTEEDVKFRYINEAITSKKWPKDSIYMEQKVKFTDGKISLHGNLVHREKPKIAIKTKLLRDFNLHTIIRLPGSIFAPYTPIATNILFFDNTCAEGAPEGYSTKETWFYRLDMPEGYKHFSKTKSMKSEHCNPIREWWNDRKEIIIADGDEKSRCYSVEDLIATDCNFDLCKFPKEDEEILPPAELLADYFKKRKALDHEIDKTLAEIQRILGINVNVDEL